MAQKKTLLVDEWGSVLRLRKGVLILMVKSKENNEETLKKKLEVAPIELDSIILAVRGTMVSTAALIEAAKYGVDVVIMDNWNPVARIVPARYGGSLRLWYEQFKAYISRKRKVEIAKAIAQGKMRNQRENLIYYGKTIVDSKLRNKLRENAEIIQQVIEKSINATTVEEVRQYEAEAARWYWNAVRQLIPRSLGFRKRLKRYSLPPGIEPDPVNKALNIAYSLLQKEVWRAAFTVGFNPYIGFLHKPRPGRMSLILDMMEEFRPLIDRTIIHMARKETNKIIKLKQKETEQEAIIEVIKQTLITLNKNKDKIWTQARKLANTILNNEPYQPYRLTY